MDGILVINKPAGMTSFDVIARLRKKIGQKKFGHAGTLDPQASGVLVVLAGSATRILPYLSDKDKKYIAQIELGRQYDTDDVFGQVENEQPVRLDFDFEEVLQSFKGPLHQRVPKASAKKVNGKKLYDYLREGKEVPVVYSDVEVYDIHALNPETLEFEVHCSSGTYIRSICRDFGEKTGNAAAMKSLIRTQANGFTLDEAQSLEDEQLHVYPIDRLLDYPHLQIENVSDVLNGKTIRLQTEYDEVLLYDKDRLLALYKRKTSGKDWFGCERGLWS